MNILFLTMYNITTLSEQGIYQDLLNEFKKNNHRVTIIAPAERQLREATNKKDYDGYSVLRVRVGNLQKTNVIEKGISTILLEGQLLSAIKRYCKESKFDLVMYSTPPITFGRIINYIRNKHKAKTYLLLKDIFPQNAVDIGMFSKRSFFYKYFRKKEKQLYKQSDYIGCMSQANVDYVINNNPFIDKNIVHVAPNSITIREKNIDQIQKRVLRERYNITQNTIVFIYGGNLGKPQDIPFIIDCLKSNENKADRFFVICGTGTEYGKLKTYMDERKPMNVLLINGLPKQEYEEFIMACDVGLIFLDHRFTIPNFPSRILSYMQHSMPVLACTDPNTDMGKIITEGNFGWWCKSDSVEGFTNIVDEICEMELTSKGKNAYKYLAEYYTSELCYETIMKKLANKRSV